MADEGVNYFPLYCTLDEKFELLEAEYGLKGFAIVVKLFQRIYKEHGYYCEWNNDISLIFAKQCGFSNIGESGKNNRDFLGGADGSAPSGRSKNLIDHVVAASLRRGIFDKKIFENYSVLTSRGIQRNFLRIVRNRKNVKIKKEYLLLSDAEIKGNVVIIDDSYIRNVDSYVRTKQSKVKESKVNNISCAAEPHDTELEAFYDSIWKLYPIKKGKGQVSKTKKKVLQKIGYEHLKRCVERFIADMESSGREQKYWMHGSTFFNSGYVDYLDKNYGSEETEVLPVQNKEEDLEELVGDDW